VLKIADLHLVQSEILFKVILVVLGRVDEDSIGVYQGRSRLPLLPTPKLGRLQLELPRISSLRLHPPQILTLLQSLLRVPTEQQRGIGPSPPFFDVQAAVSDEDRECQALYLIALLKCLQNPQLRMLGRRAQAQIPTPLPVGRGKSLGDRENVEGFEGRVGESDPGVGDQVRFEEEGLLDPAGVVVQALTLLEGDLAVVLRVEPLGRAGGLGSGAEGGREDSKTIALRAHLEPVAVFAAALSLVLQLHLHGCALMH